ncbi:DUF2933 domain-containing protein (plasmid) [Burkholderia thailandensis]|uniref:DUF2933 domain-containing protein n=1 Tax=Burkholderia thailandensis TaxID=57975 RepID=UPI00192D9969|nr:DUF2933 domain-containing protein [Burkholderia thailandensis]MBS2132107.1 DUF2933 domain-containing protein [Burkholderia thailandensis]QRA15218.1 DUF2933 domain-containing protein [Burkholderia thailandensis]
MDSGNHDHKAGGFGLSRANIVLIAFIAIGGFYLVTEHRAHLWGWLPFLLILACPLMHLFMHHGHEHGDSSESADEDEADQNRNAGSHRH